MHVHQLREAARGDLGIAADETDDGPLHAGDPELDLHPLRAALETVIDGPEETQEVERDAERARLTCRRGLRAAGPRPFLARGHRSTTRGRRTRLGESVTVPSSGESGRAWFFA